jgi:Respiratory-chain NADH dehydrogenase 51 Kd subunit
MSAALTDPSRRGSTIPATAGAAAQREVDSFYHLSGCSLSGKACRGTACFAARHLNPQRWAQAITQEPRVYCLGQCFVAPSISNGDPHPNVAIHARQGIVLERLARGGARTLDAYGGYRALEKALTKPREEIVGAVEISGLRGRGGAGFPTGRKWRAVAHQESPEKFVVANADEGDPGAYIDKLLLEDDPHALIEGMLLAAYAVGARKGWIYLRKEYPRAEEILRMAINEAHAAGFLGDQVIGRDFSFDIEIAIGQGSYVCGEETAMLRSNRSAAASVGRVTMIRTERGPEIGPRTAVAWRLRFSEATSKPRCGGRLGIDSALSPATAASVARTASRVGNTCASQRPSEDTPSGTSACCKGRRSCLRRTR